jgi:hypothetical protein
MKTQTGRSIRPDLFVFYFIVVVTLMSGENHYLNA